jgi:hypothetical protein
MRRGGRESIVIGIVLVVMDILAALAVVAADVTSQLLHTAREKIAMGVPAKPLKRPASTGSKLHL